MKTIFNRWSFVVMIIAISSFFCSCSDNDSKSDLTGLLTYGFTDETVKDYEFTVDQTAKTISNKIALAYKYDVSSLTPVWTAVNKTKVYINGELATSGAKAYDFTNDVKLKVVAENNTNSIEYTIKVNVSQNISSWNVLAASDAGYPQYTDMTGFMLNDKIFLAGGIKNFEGNGYSIYQSEDGKVFQELINDNYNNFGFTSRFTPVVFKNQVLLIGGSGYYSMTDFNEANVARAVWSSSDCQNWTKITEGKTGDELIPGFVHPNVFVKQDDIYVCGSGGASFGSIMKGTNIIVKSSDGGATWSEVAESLFPGDDDFEVPYYGGRVELDGTYYLIGGQYQNAFKPEHFTNKIYKSTNLENWTEVVTKSIFPARSGMSCFAYKGRLYLIGGRSVIDNNGDEKNVSYSDFWVSEDGGVTWEEKTDILPEGFKSRANHVTILNGNEVTIIGGVSYDEEGNASILTDSWRGTLN
ncbi:MAG: DUF6242 domain-containing protein [Marinifilaceae bacterium]|jgi:hypothetical protein|nr:DUF6242 domain-containing protein [Marinifilaceae bacterium]